MSESIKKTKRKALSWDKEYKDPGVSDLRLHLENLTKTKSVGNIEIFRLCLSIGYQSGLKRPTPPRATDAVRIEDLKETDSALFMMVALDDSKDSSILLDEDRIYDIVEQYAAQGLMILCQEMKNQPSFTDWLKETLFKNLRKQMSSK
jgi:hypothetical protein